MADTGISVFLQLKDQMSAGLGRVGAALDGIGKTASDLGSAFAGMQAGGVYAFDKIVGKVGEAYEALKQFNSQGIELNRQFENTSIRIASTLRAFDVAPTFAKAQAEAAGVMNTINNLAARLPGEAEAYISVFATALPKVIAAGMRDVGEAAKFTSIYTAVASTNMVDAGQAGMDLFRMLSGQAGADVRMWTVMAEHIGMTTEAFNKLSAPERLAKLQDAIGKFNEGLTASGDGFESVTGGVESQLKEINRLATELSFKKSKDQLAEMSRFLAENRQTLIESGEILTSTYQGIANTLEKSYEGLKLIGAKLLTDYAKVALGQDPAKAIREREAAEKRAAAGKAVRGAAALQDAALQAQLERQAERLAEYQFEKFDQIVELLPGAMQSKLKALGPSAIITQKVYDELVKLGKTAVTGKDNEKALQILKYLEFMGEERGELTHRSIFGGMDEEQKALMKKGESRLKKAKGHVTNFYNSRFDIKQEFAEGFDPDRIAVAFSQDLARLGEMKVMSGYAPLFTGR